MFQKRNVYLVVLSANKMTIIHKKRSVHLYSFIFSIKNVKTFKQ